MKILHIISSIKKESGGPARSSQGLVAALEKSGVETWLVVFNKNDQPWMDGVVHFKAFERNNYWGLKREFGQFVDKIKPDIIHIHGLWVSAVHLACVIARQKKIPYIIAPRGMLEPWAINYKKWKKIIALFLYQREDLKKAGVLHATSEKEKSQIQLLGFSQKIVVSPNIIMFPESTPSCIIREDGKKIILFLSRIHPVKGLLILVEAAFHLKKMGLLSEWHVEYAGPDYELHLKEVQGRIASLGLENDFSYLGNLDDEHKWGAYSRADLFVLPTYSENFGVVILEALYAGIPVITTKGTPWEELEIEQCGKWIDIGVEPLVVALQELMSLSDCEREIMGENGRKLVERQYTWEGVAEKMCKAYDGILGNSLEKPL